MIWQLVRVEGLLWRQSMIGLLATMSFVSLGNLGLGVALPALLLAAWLSPPRSTGFTSVLPVSGKVVYLARLIRSIISSFGVGALVVGISPLWGADYRATLSGISALMLGALMITTQDLLRPTSAALPPARERILILLPTAVVGVLALMFAPVWISLAFFAIALTASIRVAYAGAPAAFIADARVDSTGGATPRGVLERISLPLWARPSLRSAFNRNTIVFVVLSFVSGNVGSSTSLLVVAVLAIAPQLKARQKWLDTLPLSHHARAIRFLAVAAFLPILAAGAGSLIRTPFTNSRLMGVGGPDPFLDYDRYESDSRVPLAFWEVTARDTAPWIVSPWGEQSPPYQFRMLGRTYYNPFSIAKSSTKQFVEWQHIRATTAVYGVPMSTAEYDALDGDLPSHRTSSGEMRMLKFALAVSLAILMLASEELSRSFRLVRRPAIRYLVQYTVLTVFLALIVFDIANPRAGPYIALAHLNRALLALTATASNSLLPLVVLSCIPPILSYALFLFAIRRADAPKTVGATV